MPSEDYEWRLPYWIRSDPRAVALWEEGVAEYGYEGAEEYVRASDWYAGKFAGIKREDGSYRMDEGEYLATLDSYRDSLRSVGVEPSFMEDKFVAMIEGDVSGPEFWQERVLPAFERIIDRGDEMVARYENDWGLSMSREALIASFLNPELGTKILERQIGISEIRHELDITKSSSYTNRYQALTEELYERDYTLGEVRNLFEQADTMIPVMSTLARRHADPDDDFDLEEFTAATLYNDPEQARRMRRLMSQEASAFTGGAQVEYARSREGGLSGLRDV